MTADHDAPLADSVIFIEPAALDHAIALVTFLKRALVRLVRQELAPNKREAAHQKVLQHVRSAGGRMQKRVLQRRAGLSSKDFRDVMRSLTEDGRLAVTDQRVEAGQVEVWLSLVDDEGGA